ncbi:hypothetical protein YC2023_114729 [Brassica napus]
MSTTLVSSMTTTARRRRFDLDVDCGRAMSEWSLGFEVADNEIYVGEETTVVRWRRNHKMPVDACSSYPLVLGQVRAANNPFL